MFEIAPRLLAALEGTAPLAVATAVAIDGSAPRTVGTSMAFDGTVVIGSIAGGCVEGAVVGVCEEVLADGMPRTVEYGVSDETAFEVGLTCGGQLRIHVQLVTAGSPIVEQLRKAEAGQAAGIATVINESAAATRYAHRITAELDARVQAGATSLGRIDCEGEMVETFFEVSTPPPRFLIFGAMDFSAALSVAATAMGYRVTVCDPRSLFTTPERFPGVEVVVSWPTHYLQATEVDARTVICVLSHDDRFDSDLVQLALERQVAYVGAMGSRRTSDRRFAELRERAVPEEALARLHSPIGLDLGASTPEETAISILAEVLAARRNSSAAPLSHTRGSIHRA
jgi:xanthine dehydrogenase accessory factor